ncbi:RHS repeat domain-containing protein, partial [Leifsonia lichenia]
MKHASRRRALGRRSLTFAIATGATLALIGGVVEPAASRALDGPVVPPFAKAVPGEAAPELKAKSDTAALSAPVVTADVPTGGEFDVTIDSVREGETIVDSDDGETSTIVDGSWQKVGGSAIEVASAGDPADQETTEAELNAKKDSKLDSGKKRRAHAKDRADKLKVRFLDDDAAAKLGATGPVIELSRVDGSKSDASVGVRIPSRFLDAQYGGDFSSRARWVQVDAGVAEKSAEAVEDAVHPVPSVVEEGSGAIVVTPRVADSPILLAARAAPSSQTGTGDFTATPLKPASTWDVSLQNGGFSWNLPLSLPPAPGGATPELALNYSSQSVDGLTGSTNNQPSAFGEGWDLAGTGFIERSYLGCAVDDGPTGKVATSGDLCYKNTNATISFGGHSGELILDPASKTYRLANDDGTRFTEIKGAPCAPNGTADTACWQMVTTDGTQYYFGLNQLPGFTSGKAATNSAWTVPVFGNDPGEPCHASTFAASSCSLAWRWNLDYIVDTHGNAQAYYYNAQTNMYARNGNTPTKYERGGELVRIEYGLTKSSVYSANAASGKVHFYFDSRGRCSASVDKCEVQAPSGFPLKPAIPASYPDVPYDQLCTAGPCSGLISPTFWTVSRVTAIKTQAFSEGAYRDVDMWTLRQSFPSPGDGESASLWLNSVTRTGYVGGTTLVEPAVTFAGTPMQNRVWTMDGLAPLDKWRVTGITTELGATVSVTYSKQQCVPGDRAAILAAPQSNTKLCYPQWWSPSVVPAQAPQQDLFHKYVVTSIVDNPNTGGAGAPAVQKQYFYGTPAWRYNDSPLTPADKRTWAVFAGFDTAEVRVGDKNKPASQNVTVYLFFQGLDGDRATPAGGVRSASVTGSPGVPDSRQFAGRTRQVIVRNGVNGPLLSRTFSTPWSSAPTASDGLHSARFVGDRETVVWEPISDGTTRSTVTTTAFDPTSGLPTTVATVPSDAPATCTTTTYAPPNTFNWIVGAVSQVMETAGPCASASTVGADGLISGTRSYFDGGAFGAAPTAGNVTKTEIVSAVSGTVPTWSKASETTYDAMGRPTSVKDALNRTTKTAYTPSGATGQTTAIETTNAAQFSTKKTFDPARGAELSATDPNGNVTTARYDALGRRIGVWLPNRPYAENTSSPSTKYTYTLSQTAPSVVTTEVMKQAGTVVSYELLDGLGRVVQSQSAAIGSGSVIVDTAYDAQGRTVSSTVPYWATVSASTELFVASNASQIPGRTDTVFDAVGRTLASVVYKYGVETHRTTWAHLGPDRVDMTPPAGGTPTTTLTNSQGKKTALAQYQAAKPVGDGLVTRYMYDAKGNMSSMTDPAGNAWSWTHDMLGRQATSNDPDSGLTINAYDLGGRLTASKDARGVTLAYTYDALDRRTAAYSGTTSGPLLASWTYDTVAKGQLASSTSYTGSAPGKPGLAYKREVVSYDALYNATSTKVSIPTGAPAFGGTSYTFANTYTVEGQIKQRTLPAMGGLALERLGTAYNSLGLVDTLSGTSLYSLVAYTPIGQTLQLTRGTTTQLFTTFGYDAASGAVNQVIDTSQYSAKFSTQADRLYKMNAAGDVTSIATTGAAGAETQCFAYDSLHNLTEAWTPGSGNCAAARSVSALGGKAPYWTSYAVDAATGNRTSTTSHTTAGDVSKAYAYPAAGSPRPHAVASVAGVEYGYDAAGNTTTRPGQVLTFNESGKLASVTAGGVTQSKVYDADGNVLLQSDSKSGTTLFLGETELTMAPGAKDASAVRTYSVNGIPVVERSTKVGVSGSVVTFVSGDANGSRDLAVAVADGKVSRRWS